MLLNTLNFKIYIFLKFIENYHSNVTIIMVDEKIWPYDAAGMQTAPNSYFLWMKWCFMKHMWICTRPITHILLVDEPIEPKMRFVTEDDFAMKLIILAYLFHSRRTYVASNGPSASIPESA